MANSLKKRDEALDILRNYTGYNPYMLMLKKDIILNKKTSSFNDFNIEYILKNYNFKPLQINKIIKITDWYGEKKKEDWNIDFTPKKLQVISLLGETSTSYHCYIKYRRNMDPCMAFLPKKAVLTNFTFPDFHNIEIDFERFDKLSSMKSPGRVLKEHQKDAIRFLTSRKKCILADDMGMGKTVSLSVSAIYGNFDSIIIICPASLKTDWKRELCFYVPERDITIIDGFNSKTKSELEQFLGYGIGRSGLKASELLKEAKEKGKWVDNRFIIVNYDILDEFYQIPSSRSKENIEIAYLNSPMLQYIKNRKSLIIIDEAHKLSNSTSSQFKIITDLIKRGEPDSIYLSTGTPITNNAANFYNLLKIISDPVADDWLYYMERYCNAKRFPKNKEEKEKRNRISDSYIKSKNKTNWYALTEEEKSELNDIITKSVKMITVPNGESNIEELKERVSHIYLRRDKTELNALPPKYIHEIYYDLTTEQKSEYDKLWKEYEEAQLELDPEKELNKELLEGGLYRGYLSKEMVPNTIKMANKLISDGNKVVIACCYDEELYNIQEYYGNKCVIYNGKMNLKQKDEAKRKFIEDNDIMVFIGNINAASMGLTLIVSNHLIFNNMHYTYALNAQMQDRIHRIGQTKDCHIYYQMFKDTQYERMWNIVLRKQHLSDSIIINEKDK